MPGEGLTHGPPAIKKAGSRYHRFSRINPAFPARWCYSLYVISLGTGLSCPHRSRDHHLASLASASGGQDHTISPSASAPFARTNNRARRQYVHRIPPHVS